MSEQSQAQSKADRGGAPLAGHRAKAEAQNKHESLTAKRPPVPHGCAVAAGRGVGSLAAKGGQCAYTCADVADALPQTEKVSEQSQAQSKADRGGAPLAGHRAKAEAQNKHVRPDSKAATRAAWFARLARLERRARNQIRRY